MNPLAGALLVLVVGDPAPLPGMQSGEQPTYELVLQCVGELRLVQALQLADTIPEGLWRQRARAEVHYKSRDFPAVLLAADAGLRGAPDDLQLLQLATRSALWLQDSYLARKRSDRLRSALRSAALTPVERSAWTRIADDYEAQVRDFEGKARQRKAALFRARCTASALLCLCLTALAWLVKGSRTQI